MSEDKECSISLSVSQDADTAITLLYDKSVVFGNLKGPNITVSTDGEHAKQRIRHGRVTCTCLHFRWRSPSCVACASHRLLCKRLQGTLASAAARFLLGSQPRDSFASCNFKGDIVIVYLALHPLVAHNVGHDIPELYCDRSMKH